MKQSENFLRAKSLVARDNLDFNEEVFCKDLNNFLQNYFSFDSLTVSVEKDLTVVLHATNVKKHRTL